MKPSYFLLSPATSMGLSDKWLKLPRSPTPLSWRNGGDWKFRYEFDQNKFCIDWALHWSHFHYVWYVVSFLPKCLTPWWCFYPIYNGWSGITQRTVSCTTCYLQANLPSQFFNLRYVSRIQIRGRIIWLIMNILFWHKRSYSWLCIG